MSKVWIEFTKPTLNFAKGDVVELEQEYVDEVLAPVVKKRFGNTEDDGGRDRYKKVAAPKKAKGSAKVGTPDNGTTVEQTAGGRMADTANENDTKAKRAAADKNVEAETPPAAGAGK